MYFYSLRYSGLSRYYLPFDTDSYSQINLLRHIFKVSSFTLASRFIYYIYMICLLLKHLIFVRPLLKISAISNPIVNNISNEFPWCVYTNSHDKFTILILKTPYIDTIHVSNHSFWNSLPPSKN